MLWTRRERIRLRRDRVHVRTGERRCRNGRRRLLKGLLRVRRRWIRLLGVLLLWVRLLWVRLLWVLLLRLLWVWLLELLRHHLPRHRRAPTARSEPDDEADHSDDDEDHAAASPIPARVVGNGCGHGHDRTRWTPVITAQVEWPARSWLAASNAPFSLAGSVGGSFECAHVMLSNRWFEATSFWKAEHVQARRHRGAQAPPI